MMARRPRYTLSLLAALAIGLPTAMTTTPAEAGPCPNGKCSSSSGAAKAAIASVQAQVKAARGMLTGSNADLQGAYEKIVKIHAEAKDKRVDGLSQVRGLIASLAKDIEGAAAQEYTAAYGQYFYGEHTEALERFKALTKLKGVPAAKKAASEVRKEDDRAEWREALARSTELINAHDFAAARAPLSNMDRLARRTGYSDQNEAAKGEFQAVTASQIDASKQAIEREQFDKAYTTLRSISRLSPLRKTASDARGILAQTTREVTGMQQAEREYKAAERLEEVRAELSEDKPNKAAILRELQTLAAQYEGTEAAEQALALAKTLS